jgi:hypothetical protein
MGGTGREEQGEATSDLQVMKYVIEEDRLILAGRLCQTVMRQRAGHMTHVLGPCPDPVQTPVGFEAVAAGS